ncbi:YciK family oxidoreductase [Sulfurirhabdus autotrophica]|uniref:NAD(P)-dependent dehydrogenase (Short-subunit alcohol dehydrogenase family) n=1 Tax=Sulfurirhabdus autotrophica TaxID=1706046 RepID=A0A4V2W2B0_9PROT|nr:YciK family oxidoreductase [Sulfurirhabdus autotrophica]TCV87369.1 NAD(P)-dependent dehydrogenase (short-subunit alcohol dehydrogenase family) [Sulfurirhabdus autotrophica]
MKNYQATKELLKDKVILITGAGQGIGRVAAITYAAHGATVILLGRNVQNLEAVYDEIESAGYAQPAIFPLDLEKATDAEYEALAQAIKLQLGRLDGILHNAVRFFSLCPIELQTLDQWNSLLRVNLIAPFALTRACLPIMKESPDASIIMTSETHGHTPAAYWGGFAVSKGGVETMVKIWAQEFEMFQNLRINALIPGPVQSTQRAKTHPGEFKDTMPKPEDLMPIYLYLMGKDSKKINGEIVAC